LTLLQDPFFSPFFDISKLKRLEETDINVAYVRDLFKDNGAAMDGYTTHQTENVYEAVNATKRPAMNDLFKAIDFAHELLHEFYVDPHK
jgi:hypothetical protein